MHEGERVGREAGWRRAILAGDEAAWRALYDQSYAGLHAYALWRCGGLRDRAEDAVQETWLHAVRRLKDFDPERASFAGWLRGIAANLLRNRFRRDAVRRTLPLDGESVAPDHRAAAERVAAALSALPPRCEMVLRAKYLDGQSMAEIAAATGETIKAVESLLSRARQAFRDAYLEPG